MNHFRYNAYLFSMFFRVSLEQKMKKLLLVFALVFITGCLPAAKDRITQTSTIDALLAGAYDGQMQCRKLLDYGDFGIGTFDKLDGEMTVLDGKIYQIKSDGKVYRPVGDVKTPFATVCKFKPDIQFPIQPADFKTAESIIDEKIPNQNTFLAVEISGKFKHIKVRSVPTQQKPYPPLAEVAKTQPVFEINDITGTIVGFRSPPFVKGINVSGYHFHFLSSDFTQGGHVLDFELISGECKIDKCNEFLLILPKDDVLKDIDLSTDKTEELQKVEK
jgi:acetolactate decarboxylase